MSEYSSSQTFEDHSSLAFVNRNITVPKFNASGSLPSYYSINLFIYLRVNFQAIQFPCHDDAQNLMAC
jgi:hypothetical protein